MNRSFLLRVTATLIAGGALMFAQAPPQGEASAEGEMAPAAPVSTSPVAPQPAPQSQEEITAIQGIMGAATADARFEAIDQFVIDYPDSQFKPTMLQLAAMTAQMTNDYDKLIIYGERTLEADPNNYTAMIAMAGALAQRTRENDLDKEEKLNRAEDYANRSLGLLEDAPRPNPGVTDDEWAAEKNNLRGQCHSALGFVAMARGDHEKAVEEFRTAVQAAADANPTAQLMLARELSEIGSHQEAINVLDAMLADPQAPPQVRQLAEQQRKYAEQQMQGQ